MLKGVGLAGTGHFATQALTLVSYLALARLLSPDDYGVFASAALFIGVGVMLSGAGLNAALVQRRDRFEEAANTAVLSSLASGIALGMLALALSPLIGAFFRETDVAVLAAALSGTVPLRTACIVPDALMQRAFSFRRRLIVDPSAALSFGLAALAGVSAGLGPWGLVLATYVSGVVRLSLSWKLAGWRPELRRASRAMWLELAGFGRHVLGAEVMRRIAAELPAAVIGRYSGTDAIGNYRYAERIGMQPQTALTSVASYVLLPAFSRIAEDADRLREASLRSLRSLAVVAVPGGLMLFALGEAIAVVLLGEQWREAGLVMMGLSVYVASRFPISVASEILKAVGSPRQLPRIHRFSLVMTIVAVALLFRYGVVAVAAGLSLGSVLTAIYAMRSLAGAIGVGLSAPIRAVAPAVVAALAMAGAVTALDRQVVHAAQHGTWPGLILLLADALAAVVVYLAVLVLVAPDTTDPLRRAARKAAHRLGHQGRLAAPEARADAR